MTAALSVNGRGRGGDRVPKPTLRVVELGLFVTVFGRGDRCGLRAVSVG